MLRSYGSNRFNIRRVVPEKLFVSKHRPERLAWARQVGEYMRACWRWLRIQQGDVNFFFKKIARGARERERERERERDQNKEQRVCAK